MFAKPIPGRTTAAAEGEVVVFLIGMRINHFRAPRHWMPVFTGMLRMLRELSGIKGSGLMGYQLLSGSPRTYYVVQYWESKEKLLEYAAAPDRLHHKAWAMINRFERGTRMHVGIWHETYVVQPGSYESIYGDMPLYGLAAATGVLPVEQRGVTARERLARGAEADG
ncbi:DUF4188 domain-containing protein [Streptomyces sp. G-G2]|uniref:DUF4188 domain-containing protein n=1 Tax=Streptomyces sp. G-G2 TaxID=3046201 RepID=UPI0024BBBB91|nr:DUF4188 domain-containing protein [Streptomyces sp. G-G2]MDJ0381197.1 DUF4188 domain-containing protein [Streptomyces sp. G-G2]